MLRVTLRYVKSKSTKTGRNYWDAQDRYTEYDQNLNLVKKKKNIFH